MFNSQKEFPKKHHGITFCNSKGRCKHLLLRIFYFTITVFYKFMSLLNDDLSSNEWLLMLIDLLHFRRVFDDIASNFFRHFSYEPSETAVLSEVESPGLLWLLFSHHHTSKGHNSSMPYKYDSLYRLFFSTIRHRY